MTFAGPLPRYAADSRPPGERGPFCFEDMSDETHFSAEQAGSQAPSRLPRPQGDGRRPQRAAGAPGQGPQEAHRLIGLSKRRDFLAANRGKRAVMPGFILLMRERGDDDPAIRFGITVTKKIGGAVIRNRMKRRFRELARAILPLEGQAGADYVMIGRAGGVERDFGLLRDELGKAVSKLTGAER